MKLHQIIWKEFKADLKSNLIFTSLIFLLFFWFVSIFDPDLFGGMEEVFENYPEGIKEMVGGQLAIAEFGGFIHTYLFSMAWFYLGFYFVMRAANDIPKEIEDKTIDLMLSKPIKRWEFSIGKYISHVIGAIILVVGTYFAVLIGIFSFPNVDPAEVYYEELNFAFLWLLMFLIALISSSFFFSSFLDTKKSLVFSLGFMIFFYIIGVYAELFGEDYENIKYISIFYYFNTADLLINNEWEFVFRDLMVISSCSLAFTISGVVIFSKRDIPV